MTKDFEYKTDRRQTTTTKTLVQEIVKLAFKKITKESNEKIIINSQQRKKKSITYIYN